MTRRGFIQNALAALGLAAVAPWALIAAPESPPANAFGLYDDEIARLLPAMRANIAVSMGREMDRITMDGRGVL